jgi:hypothetical protein
VDIVHRVRLFKLKKYATEESTFCGNETSKDWFAECFVLLVLSRNVPFMKALT